MASSEKPLSEMAYRDELTGLPNRVLLSRELERQTLRNPGEYGLVFIDVDDLKSTNDAFGHPAGDQLLRNTAAQLDQSMVAPAAEEYPSKRTLAQTVTEALSRTLRFKRDGKEDYIGRGVFRLSGDEFVVILAGAETQEKVDRAIERLSAALTEKEIKASMGGRPHKPGESGMDLLADVDAMMYVNKKARKAELRRKQIEALPLHKRLAYWGGQILTRYSGIEAGHHR